MTRRTLFLASSAVLLACTSSDSNDAPKDAGAQAAAPTYPGTMTATPHGTPTHCEFEFGPEKRTSDGTDTVNERKLMPAPADLKIACTKTSTDATIQVDVTILVDQAQKAF